MPGRQQERPLQARWPAHHQETIDLNALDTWVQETPPETARRHDLHDRTRRPGIAAGSDQYLAMIESICEQAVRDGRSYLELITALNRQDALTGRDRIPGRSR